MTDLISDHNLSDCLALLFCLLPSPLSLSLCSWSGWRQQKQVSDVVDYAGLHSPGWRGAGSRSFRGQEVHSPSFSQTQVTTVSPFNSSDCSFDCELNPYQGITEKTCFIWSELPLDSASAPWYAKLYHFVGRLQLQYFGLMSLLSWATVDSFFFFWRKRCKSPLYTSCSVTNSRQTQVETSWCSI